MAINNHGNTWGGWQPPSKGLCCENFLLSWLLRLRRYPPLSHKVKIEETRCEYSGEQQVIFEAWLRITYTLKESASSRTQLPRNSPATSSESPKAQSLESSTHNENTLQPKSTPQLLHCRSNHRDSPPRGRRTKKWTNLKNGLKELENNGFGQKQQMIANYLLALKTGLVQPWWFK